jgi:hypothetical protein
MVLRRRRRGVEDNRDAYLESGKTEKTLSEE